MRCCQSERFSYRADEELADYVEEALEMSQMTEELLNRLGRWMNNSQVGMNGGNVSKEVGEYYLGRLGWWTNRS